jgi:hypothetical protein
MKLVRHIVAGRSSADLCASSSRTVLCRYHSNGPMGGRNKIVAYFIAILIFVCSPAYGPPYYPPKGQIVIRSALTGLQLIRRLPRFWQTPKGQRAVKQAADEFSPIPITHIGSSPDKLVVAPSVQRPAHVQTPMDDISRMARPRSPFSQLPGGKSLPLTEGEQMAFSEAATIARFGNIASAAPYKDAGIATFLTKDHSRTAAADVIRSAARNARAVASRYAAAAKSERLKKQVLSQEDKQQESNSINLESLEKQKYEEAKKLDELADACSALFLFRR